MLLYNPKTGKGINVPDIDAPGWMSIRGYTTTPPQGLEEVEQPPLFSPAVIPLPKPEAMAVASVEPVESTALISPESAVLAFINAAEKTYQLTAIPTVGHAAARSIIENRPEGGYESLDDLEGILPQRSSLSAIKAWMPTNG
jgi:hypothetical protein